MFDGGKGISRKAELDAGDAARAAAGVALSASLCVASTADVVFG
jgi:hypothetical protein